MSVQYLVCITLNPVVTGFPSYQVVVSNPVCCSASCHGYCFDVTAGWHIWLTGL